MSKVEDGGAAFPAQATQHFEGCVKLEAHHGMTLRDYFAAKAMQAAATNPTGADGFTFSERAAWAYQQADAMLKARQS